MGQAITIATDPDEVSDEIESVSYHEDDIDDDAPCPICGKEFNHVVRNGFRNQFPRLEDQLIQLCTDDRPVMFVHVVSDPVSEFLEEYREQHQNDSQNSEGR